MGHSGLHLSVLSLGTWVTFGTADGLQTAVDCFREAYDAGINFFDCAEVYGQGQAETVMGQALKKLGLRRGSYTISTKFYWGLNDSVNEKNTLNRKRLREAMEGSLRRLQVEEIDLVFCHRDDLRTPIEEICLTMHEFVQEGRAHYWGTSEWSPARIVEAVEFCRRHGLHAPRMEQPQYSLLERKRFEQDLGPILAGIPYGTTTWSPLASGLLTGKYDDGIPPGSRLDREEWLRGSLTADRIAKSRALQAIAEELGCTRSQLAIAWCAKNPLVTTVITGASRVEQLRENLKALDVMAKLTPEVMDRIDAITK